MLTTLVAGCVSDARDANARYVDSVSERFETRRDWPEVLGELWERRARNTELWNPCKEEYELLPTSCDSGYSLVTTIPLPQSHWLLGEGEGQLYFSFNEDLVLEEHSAEIYYSRH